MSKDLIVCQVLVLYCVLFFFSLGSHLLQMLSIYLIPEGASTEEGEKQKGKEQMKEGDYLLQCAVCLDRKTISLLCFLEAQDPF